MTDQRSAIVARIVQFPFTRLILGIGTLAGVLAAASAIARAIDPQRGSLAAIAVATLVAAMAIGGYLAFTMLIERRGNVEFALPGALRELGVGLLLGFGLFSAVVAVIAALGGYQVIGTRDASVLAGVVALSITSGVVEEILLRGLIFRLIEEWLGSWAALVLSAALFGAAHLGNDNATLLAGAAIALEAGIMLAAVFMVTRRLWAAIGLHAAWNFTQGGIYGIAISGNQTDGLLRARISGPDLLTGGAFGAEASLPAILICTAFGIGVVMLAQRRGQFMAPMWVRRRQGAAVQL